MTESDEEILQESSIPYIDLFNNARLRNASLERIALHETDSLDSLLVFADFIQAYPRIPLKTTTDTGEEQYSPYSYEKIVSAFFTKIAADIYSAGDMKSLNSQNQAAVAEIMAQSMNGNFTIQEFEQMERTGIDATVIPNILTAHNISATVERQGRTLADIRVEPVSRRTSFNSEFQRALEKGNRVLETASDIEPEAMIAFAHLIQQYPFIPIKFSKNTANQLVDLHFITMVTEFCEKMSHMVIQGKPVRAIAAAQIQKAQEFLSKTGLNLKSLTFVDNFSIGNIEAYNGILSPTTIPNLITAEKLIAQSGKQPY